MKSRTTRRLREMLARMPGRVQQQARDAFRLFSQSPSHPGLRFKPVNVPLALYSARVGLGYRAIAKLEGDTAIWFWVGSHADYDQFLSQL